MAADRESGNRWSAAGAVGQHGEPLAAALRSMASEPAGGASAAEPARAAPAAVAPEPGLAAVEQLNRRIAELEQRLAGLSAAAGASLARPADAEPGALRRARATAGADRRHRRLSARHLQPGKCPSRPASGRKARPGCWTTAAAPGPRVLFVPSLINRAYILDLMPEASMLRWLAAHGVRPLLLDWGWPGEVERRVHLTDYVAGRLERALAAVAGRWCWRAIAWAGCWRWRRRCGSRTGCAPGVAGHAVGLPRRRPRQARTPGRAAADAGARDGSSPAPCRSTRCRSLFALLDPGGVAAKYRAFAGLDQATRAGTHVRRHGGLAERRRAAGGAGGAGVPGGLVRRQHAGARRVADRGLAGAARGAGPAQLRARCRRATGSCRRKARCPWRHCCQAQRCIEPAAGHVGMVAGTPAEALLWQPFAGLAATSLSRGHTIDTPKPIQGVPAQWKTSSSFPPPAPRSAASTARSAPFPRTSSAPRRSRRRSRAPSWSRARSTRSSSARC